jgi:release factor glutamine methyltransferase
VTSVRSLLTEGKNSLTSSETPYLDALVLLEWASRRDRGFLLAELNAPAEELLGTESVDLFHSILKRRRTGEPVAYITGHKEFYGLDFVVGPGVLVPRPDSEVVVERSVELLRLLTGGGAPSRTVTVYDCCTGSGCIGISTVAAFSRKYPGRIELVLSDLDDTALSWCRRNVQNLGPGLGTNTGISILSTDLVRPEQAVDLITANPPYLSSDETRSALSAGWGEPEMALAAGPDGLEIVRKIIPRAFSHLLPGGYLVMEHGSSQGEAVRELCRRQGFESIRTGRDLADNERYVEARKPSGINENR